MDNYQAYKLSIRALKRLRSKPPDFVGAREDLDKVILFNPHDHGAYITRARLNFDEQNYDAAIDDWTHVIQINPTNGEGNYDRGIVYQTMGLYDDAIVDFRKALELFDLFPEFQNDIGRAVLRADVIARLEQIRNQP